jgi:hypothetical protein
MAVLKCETAINAHWRNGERNRRTDDTRRRKVIHTLIKCMSIPRVLHLDFCSVSLVLSVAQKWSGMISPKRRHINFTPLLFGLQWSWRCPPDQILSGAGSSESYPGDPPLEYRQIHGLYCIRLSYESSAIKERWNSLKETPIDPSNIFLIVVQNRQSIKLDSK